MATGGRQAANILYSCETTTKLFKTNNIETVEFCQDQFGFDKSDVLWTRLVRLLMISKLQQAERSQAVQRKQ